jgi:tetratricopeptide (TPR) repeat protein
MPYIDTYANHLNDIIYLIDNDKIKGPNNALDKFKGYLSSIQGIGTFNTVDWRESWRKKVWKFGELFKKKNAFEFLKLIDDQIRIAPFESKEALEFIRSEIAFNFLSNDESKSRLIKLTQTYPLNPEFRHTLGHYNYKDKDFLAAANMYKIALKIDKNNDSFIQSCFGTDQAYLNNLIQNSDYNTADAYLKLVMKDDEYINLGNISNTIFDFQVRINDHKLFQNKLMQVQEEFRERMNKELDSERKRIIEILGFFAAIIAFILSTVSIGKNFSFIEATYFIIALGLVLLLFAVTLSILFKTLNRDFTKDIRFWILLVSIFLLIAFVFNMNSIAMFIANLIKK